MAWTFDDYIRSLTMSDNPVWVEAKVYELIDAKLWEIASEVCVRCRVGHPIAHNPVSSKPWVHSSNETYFESPCEAQNIVKHIEVKNRKCADA